MSTTSKRQDLALERFLETFDHEDLLIDLGPKLTCAECEALAVLLESNFLSASAATLRQAHAESDEEGDMREHLELKQKLESNDK